ncbi:holo-ACP synthase [Asticcacaulis excentricus]|uniref:Holo-[acyl-carrier-protein] synthase n=1 Tax=Asticcacaulis excentricus (strain ATCC 15261 / DSM 4724 / KCTC 12464 / NCIMB 9791 / VKM B-1370 / CB 48) TaxID=573065 RepID=E8RSX9_ASTEC|nr:holo-ACP synthase [Asticcacaulis excentricus]ADU14600.1 holo-acyl-carrier-protein synthase [Asticcacaulis excentricus CB 48]
MILGVGMDLTDAARIRQSVERFGQKFLDRVFTPAEQAYALSKTPVHPTLAKRFAAKEAVMKALGSGLRGFHFADIEVRNDTLGKPEVTLKNGALDRLQALLPQGCAARIHLSLTDEGDLAGAYVIIEALPE